MGWAIALHGGAGDISKDLPADRKHAVEASLAHCLRLGVSALQSNLSALDVTELVVCMHARTHMLRYKNLNYTLKIFACIAIFVFVCDLTTGRSCHLAANPSWSLSKFRNDIHLFLFHCKNSHYISV